MEWSLSSRTGIKGSLEKNVYKHNKDTWIRNHIHDSNQILKVTFSNGKKIEVPVVINGRLQPLEKAFSQVSRRYRFIDDEDFGHDNADVNYENEFENAYEKWLELYNMPEQAEAIAPVFADVEVQPSPRQSNWFSNMFTRKARSPTGVLTDGSIRETRIGGKTRKRKTRRNLKRKNKKV